MQHLRLYISGIITIPLLISCGAARKSSIQVIGLPKTSSQSTGSTGDTGSLYTNSNLSLSTTTTTNGTTTITTPASTIPTYIYYVWTGTLPTPTPTATPSPTPTSTPTVSVSPAVFYPLVAKAETGTEQRMINHYFKMPGDTSAYARLVLRRLKGLLPPSDCITSGVPVMDFYGPFLANETLQFKDDTLSEIGELFSYRLCVYDASSTVAQDVQNIGVTAFDMRSPDPLIEFAQGATSVDSTIALSIKYPSSVADYARVDIRRVAGASAPAESCIQGTLVTSFTSFADQVYLDTTVAYEAGDTFSYRACLYDRSNNLTNVNISLGLKKYVSAKWYLATDKECTSFCSNLGKTNVASPEGTKCVSGEVWVKSAEDAGIKKLFGCYGTGCYALTTITPAQSDSGSCYMSHQKHDWNPTDRTLACYCK